MLQLEYLRRENDINKIIKAQRKDKSEVKILFLSLWDDCCKKLVKKLHKKYSGKKGKKLYLVHSFYMPHSFVIFKTSKVPALVTLKGKISWESSKSWPNVDGITVEDYPARIMKELAV